MSVDLAIAALAALFLWWASTGVILYLDRLPKRTFAWSLGAATALAAIGVWLLVWSADKATPAGAYAAFVGVLLVWGWHELSFLLGVVTGPRRTPCPEGARGWRRFRYATETVIHHELALTATFAIIIAALWSAPNSTAVWAYATLWCMRLSAKLNIFLGVPNLAQEFLPAHLAFLKSYFRQAPMNPLFPISVTAGALIVGMLLLQAAASTTGAYESVSLTLVAVLLGLAVVEHWMMLLPLADAALWRWALKREDTNASHEHRIVAPTAPTGRG